MEEIKTHLPLQIIHHHFPKTKDEFVNLIERTGCGGFVVNAFSPWNCEDEELHSRYLRNRDDLDALNRFILWCKEFGLRVWIYDEPGFPSGAAGKRVVRRNPEWAVKGICCHELEITEKKGQIDFTNGKVLSAVVKDKHTGNTVVLDVDENNRISWDLPHPEYTAFIVETHFLKWITGSKVPYIDVLNPDAIRCFIEETHEQYKKQLSPEAFEYIEAYFSDEPGLPTHGCSMIFEEELAVLPWTDGMPDDFLKSFGYDIIPHLHELFYDEDTNVRCDYWKWVSNRFKESYFDAITNWCSEHNQKLTGHLYGEENLAMQIGLNGTLFELMCSMTIPGVDRLFCINPHVFLPEKMASSAADLMGYDYVMSESSAHFEESWWHSKYDATDIRQSMTYQYVLGVNTIASYFGASSCTQDELKQVYSYIGKVGSILNGRHLAQVLVHIPMEKAWDAYRPVNYKYWSVDPDTVSGSQCSESILLDRVFSSSLSDLLDHQLDFDLINTAGLLGKTQLSDGKISTHHESFSAFMFIDTDKTDSSIYDYAASMMQNNIPVLIVKYGQQYTASACRLISMFPGLCLQAEEGKAGEILSQRLRPVVKINAGCKVWTRSCQKGNEISTLVYCHSGSEETIAIEDCAAPSLEVINPLDDSTCRINVENNQCSITVPSKAGIIIRQKLMIS